MCLNNWKDSFKKIIGEEKGAMGRSGGNRRYKIGLEMMEVRRPESGGRNEARKTESMMGGLQEGRPGESGRRLEHNST